MAKRGYKIELFTGKDGKSYFRKKSANGKTMSDSQGYSTKSNARRAAKHLFPGITIVDLDKKVV
jgi:uncharacterized protein YegP (UPF0339 family)